MECREEDPTVAGHNFALRLPRFSHRLITTERDEAVQFGLQSLGTFKDGAGDFDRRNLFANNARAKISSRQEAQFLTHFGKPPRFQITSRANELSWQSDCFASRNRARGYRGGGATA